MSNGKPTYNSDSSYMSSIPVCCFLRAMQPTSSLLRWTDDLHKIFLEAVEYQGGPYEVKPTAVKEKMEAMGVTGLTIWNIKSHLQRYREKCNLGPEPPRDVRGTASPRKAGDNVTSETETVVDSDAATNLTEMEVLLIIVDSLAWTVDKHILSSKGKTWSVLVHFRAI
ncbi:hypothetical protein VPH35_076582 [Triticum aestivum]|uniref:protein PHR1-LIKE 3 n=1 Tax=Triticum aestivum TaxID=4565 RepID=UPI001D00AAD9|nr:protein PHR1-LIKE 3-like [Triticum aestivum]XP_044373440.1 protein PHR1-LIKE 3-like [Triticum aestivum]